MPHFNLSLQVIKEDKHAYLARTAHQFTQGKEAWRAFPGFSAEQVQDLVSAAGARTAGELAADAKAVLTMGEVAYKHLFVVDEPFEDRDAQLACAMKDGQDGFWREFRLVS